MIKLDGRNHGQFVVMPKYVAQNNSVYVSTHKCGVVQPVIPEVTDAQLMVNLKSMVAHFNSKRR